MHVSMCRCPPAQLATRRDSAQGPRAARLGDVHRTGRRGRAAGEREGEGFLWRRLAGCPAPALPTPRPAR